MTEPMIFPRESEDVAVEMRDRDEVRYTDSIALAAQMAMDQNVKFIFLAGPSCSGKTTTARTLIRELTAHGKRVMSFSTDDFFFNVEDAPKNEDGSPNFDAFEHTDSQYIGSVLKRLSEGKNAVLPVFDFETSRRTQQVVPVIAEDWDIFILEGIHALNDKILASVPDKIPRICFYLNATRGISYEGLEDEGLSPEEIRFCRRLIRDFKHRFATGERTYYLWENVIGMEKEILHPFEKNAALTIATDFSYEIAVEKKEVLELLSAIPEESPYRKNADELAEKLAPFPSFPASLVPEHSVLREFID